MKEILEIVTHFDSHLFELVQSFGGWIYLILFLIIFFETGLIIMPFLPGDSLLFSLGSICAVRPDLLNIYYLTPLLILAAILGDRLNFTVGSYFRDQLLGGKENRLINKNNLKKAENFYAKYGGKAIFLARFVPIIRTYAPFVAGMSRMSSKKFFIYNVTGGVVWISLFSLAGYFFGDAEIVKKNFSLFILAIIIVSLLPVVYELIKNTFFSPSSISKRDISVTSKD